MLKTIAQKLNPTTDAIDLLKADHRRVESLFKDFEKAEKRSKLRIAKKICAELETHAMIEESVFYPEAKNDPDVERDMVNEGIVEHEGIKRLVQLIPNLKASDEFFETRVKVLKEYVQHHVKEEESTLFPAVVESGVDLTELGDRLVAAKARHLRGASRRAS